MMQDDVTHDREDPENEWVYVIFNYCLLHVNKVQYILPTMKVISIILSV